MKRPILVGQPHPRRLLRHLRAARLRRRGQRDRVGHDRPGEVPHVRVRRMGGGVMSEKQHGPLDDAMRALHECVETQRVTGLTWLEAQALLDAATLGEARLNRAEAALELALAELDEKDAAVALEGGED